MLSLTVLLACSFVGAAMSASLLHLDPPTRFGTSRIIHGESVTSVDTFPHQLSLRLKSIDFHICGASVIDEGWALTAAHCVDGRSTTDFVVVGNYVDRNDEENAFRIELKEIIMHENYNQGSGAFPNDIALLRLKTLAPSNKIVKVADSSYGDFTDFTCQISGWGNLVNGSAPDLLQKADVQVLSENGCEREWGTQNILSQHICVWGTEGDRSGSCNGDSGGPLTCVVGGTPVLAGVTSWGRSGCHVNGEVTHPSVYARTSSFHTWIRTNCDNCI